MYGTNFILGFDQQHSVHPQASKAVQLQQCVQPHCLKPAPQTEVDDRLQCDICEVEVENALDLRTHKESKHSLYCDLCKVEFVEESQLLTHNKTLHEKKGKRSKQKQESGQKEAHNLIKTPKKSSNTQSMKGPTKTIDLAKLHEALEHEPLPYLCATCGDKFATVPDLQVHRAGHNEAKIHKCSICNQETDFRPKISYSIYHIFFLLVAIFSESCISPSRKIALVYRDFI